MTSKFSIKLCSKQYECAKTFNVVFLLQVGVESILHKRKLSPSNLSKTRFNNSGSLIAFQFNMNFLVDPRCVICFQFTNGVCCSNMHENTSW